MKVWIVQDESGSIVGVYWTEEAARTAQPDRTVSEWPVTDAPMSPELRERMRAQYGSEIR